VENAILALVSQYRVTGSFAAQGGSLRDEHLFCLLRISRTCNIRSHMNRALYHSPLCSNIKITIEYAAKVLAIAMLLILMNQPHDCDYTTCICLCWALEVGADAHGTAIILHIAEGCKIAWVGRSRSEKLFPTGKFNGAASRSICAQMSSQLGQRIPGWLCHQIGGRTELSK